MQTVLRDMNPPKGPDLVSVYIDGISYILSKFGGPPSSSAACPGFYCEGKFEMKMPYYLKPIGVFGSFHSI